MFLIGIFFFKLNYYRKKKTVKNVRDGHALLLVVNRRECLPIVGVFEFPSHNATDNAYTEIQSNYFLA